MIQSIKSIFIAIRPKTLSVSIAPVLVGSSVALRDGNFNTDIFLLTLIAALFIQIGTNFTNDVYDFIKGADNDNRIGPTRAVQAELISVQNMKKLIFFEIENIGGKCDENHIAIQIKQKPRFPGAFICVMMIIEEVKLFNRNIYGIIDFFHFR